MQISHSNPTSGSRDSDWILLAEVPLDEWVQAVDQGDGHLSGWLPMSMEMGIPPDRLKNIESKLAEFADQALRRFQQDQGGLPFVMRLFYQKKGNRAGDFAAGCGYFLIERSIDSDAGCPAGCQHFVDLYLYKEGE